MPHYHFPADAGTSLPEGPTPAAIAARLQQLGLPAVQVFLQGETAVLAGAVPDTATETRLVLAVGNIAGIALVDDQLSASARPSLLEGLGAFARLPAGAAGTEAAEQTVHAAQPEPHEAFGPDGSLFHRVQSGESFARIAERHYGNAAEARRIEEANAFLHLGASPGAGVVVRVPA